MEHLTSAIKHTEMVLRRMGKCRHLPQRGGGAAVVGGRGGTTENMSDDPSVCVCVCVRLIPQLPTSPRGTVVPCRCALASIYASLRAHTHVWQQRAVL